MIIGRLGIHKPILGFEFIKGLCGCILVGTPIAYFTWYNRDCKCQTCLNYVCKCEDL